MNLTGIITEYNPFHNGHKLHLESAKKTTNCDGIVCVMSGNFVQRGEAALLDKWSRTEMALKNGVDLIIELPTYYALSSAENFAFGAISILNSLNCINSIFFGSECGDIELLKKIAIILTDEPIKFKEILKFNLNKGMSYPNARENALNDYLEFNSKNILSSSNNILGIEYIKSLIKLNSKIIPHTLKREGANYNDENITCEFSSATAIRNKLKNNLDYNSIKNTLPKESLLILKDKLEYIENLKYEEKIFDFLKYRLLTNCVNFNNVPYINEGLDKKLLKEIYNSSSYNEFILNCKSKRYTYTKLSRIATKIFIGIDSYDENILKDPNNLYCRILGFNSKGREILKEIKKNSNIKIITKVGKNIDNDLLKLDIQATRSYSLLNSSINPNNDFLQSPIIIY